MSDISYHLLFGKDGQVIENIVYKSTPSHGYFVLEENRLPLMRQEHPSLTKPDNYYDGGMEFEHDCEWSRVVCAFWREFKVKDVQNAIKSLSAWHPLLMTGWAHEIDRAHQTKELIELVGKDLPVKLAGRKSEEVTIEEYFQYWNCGGE